MTAIAKALQLKGNIYNVIANSHNPYGVSAKELVIQIQNEIVDDDEIRFSDAIESLISDRIIRAYFPDNSVEYYFQVIRK